MNQETALVLAYMGGLFDGEGNASIIHVKARESSPARLATGRRTVAAQNVPKLQLKMTDEEPVRLFHGVFGGCFFNYQRPNRKKVYGWTVSHRKAERAARALLPFVRVKGPQLRKVLSHYEREAPHVEFDPA